MEYQQTCSRLYPRPPAADGWVVAVVDDNAADAGLVVMAIREAISDAEVETYTSAEEFLNRMQIVPQSRAPDLVFLDLYMPGMGGLSALDALKSDPATRVVPVIAMSGVVSESTLARAYDSHANCVIQKCGDLDGFLHTVSQCALFWRTIAVQPSPARVAYGKHA